MIYKITFQIELKNPKTIIDVTYIKKGDEDITIVIDSDHRGNEYNIEAVKQSLQLAQFVIDKYQVAKGIFNLNGVTFSK